MSLACSTSQRPIIKFKTSEGDKVAGRVVGATSSTLRFETSGAARADVDIRIEYAVLALSAPIGTRVEAHGCQLAEYIAMFTGHCTELTGGANTIVMCASLTCMPDLEFSTRGSLFDQIRHAGAVESDSLNKVWYL